MSILLLVPICVVYGIGFLAAFLVGANKANKSYINSSGECMFAGVFCGLLWPLFILTWIATGDITIERVPSTKTSRRERRAMEERRIAEHKLAAAQALQERERTLGLIEH